MCEVRKNIEPGVSHMGGKPMESRVRVWTDFKGGWRRGSGKAEAKIITMIFLYMRPDSETFGFPIQWTKEAREQSEYGKRASIPMHLTYQSKKINPSTN